MTEVNSRQPDHCDTTGPLTFNSASHTHLQVAVTFNLDANGILSVSAVDKTTQAQASITIANTTHRNSKDDVARMVREAEQFAAADAALKKKADTRRALEDLIFDILDDDTAKPTQREAAEAAEEWLRTSFERCSLEEIEGKAAALRA